MIGRALLAAPLLGRLLRGLVGAPRPVADPDETNRVAEAVDYLEARPVDQCQQTWPITTDDYFRECLRRQGAAIRDVLHDEARRMAEGA